MLIAQSPLLKSSPRVPAPQVAPLHHLAVEPKADAAHLSRAPDVRDDFYLRGLQPAEKLRGRRLPGQRAVYQVLELHLGARLARAQRLLVFAPRGGGAQHFPARFHLLQAVLEFDLAHDFFGALLALPFADDLPVEIHPRGHNVDVVILRPPVLDD